MIKTALYLVAALNGTGAGAVNEFSGVPRIIDGDTVAFGTTSVQLEGIDAPQIDQLCFDERGAERRCGLEAREQLGMQVQDKRWECRTVSKNLYGRLLAKCEVNGQDIARQMVRSGWAIASTTGLPIYLENEKEARLTASGLWAGAFVAPLDWRQHNGHAKILGRPAMAGQLSSRLLMSAFGSDPPSPECAIKGNVNTEGKCIFHRPTGRWYKRISMEARHGDRWFCSATEAIAFGCRETRR
ncbi:thermonuclease family protein [Bradyrhizobium sp. USDA 10063]